MEGKHERSRTDLGGGGNAGPPDQQIEGHPALRINQLDAAELDNELAELMKGQLKKVFKYFGADLLVKYGPEVSALLRLTLWTFSLRSSNATVGQKLLQLRYKDIRLPSSGWISYKQKLLFVVITVLGPWLQERAADLSILTRNYPQLQTLWHYLEKSGSFWKVASLVNFLIFLRQGSFQFLVERALKIQALFPQRVGARQVSFEFMDREMLWHGFAEFLFFILPLINFRKVKNFMLRNIRYRATGDRNVKDVVRSRSDYFECGICGQEPANVHEIPDCVHVFCYFCLAGNFKADPKFCCPLCGQTIDSVSQIKPVIVPFNMN